MNLKLALAALLVSTVALAGPGGGFVAAQSMMKTQRPATDAGTCYTIADADARAYCLAKARHEPGTCYTIQRADLRSQCLAEVRK